MRRGSPHPVRFLVVLAALAGAQPACHGCQSRARAGGGDVPRDLHIGVEVDGREVQPIDFAMLAVRKPDFVEGGKRAWRLASLVGAAALRPNAVLEIEDDGGIRTQFSTAAERATGHETVLMMNQRGEVLVAFIKPDEPWPAFHGRGGNRGRPGDPAPRVRAVRRVRVLVSGSGQRLRGGSGEPVLTALVDGRSPVSLGEAELQRVSAIQVAGDSGDGKRDAWPLRELVRTLVSERAVAFELVGEGGRKLAIDAAAWRDPARIPILRVNRRGLLRFNWVSPAGQPLEDDGLRGVSEIRIHP
jgi:hypothetical protein